MFNQAQEILHKAFISTPENQALVNSHIDPTGAAQALCTLKACRILTPANCAAVSNYATPSQLTDALIYLTNAGAFPKDYPPPPSTAINASGLSLAFYTLQQARLLGRDNKIIIDPLKDPHVLAARVMELHGTIELDPENFFEFLFNADKNKQQWEQILTKAKILTPENIALLIHYPYPRFLTKLLDALQKQDLLNQDNLSAIMSYPDQSLLIEGLGDYLIPKKLLTQEHLALVLKHPRADLMAEGIYGLKQYALLTPDNLHTIFSHQCPQDLAQAIAILNGVGLLTPENQAQLKDMGQREDFSIAFGFLMNTELLTQENFSALIAPEHQALLTEEAETFVWGRIPEFQVDQAVLQRLFTAAEHAEPMEELQRVVDEILAVPGEAPAIINNAQSTHTASVHRSVSAAAQSLQTLYQTDLVLDDKLAELKADILSQPGSEKNDAAKRALTRLFSSGFTDSSGVSLRQLLALAYVAIHDDSRRLGSLADAKTLLIEGLYEIQRGYNLNAHGVDDGAADLPICWAGSFNKIIEKLNGIHTDVSLVVVTRAMATAKFPKLAAAKAQEYLQSLAATTTATAAKSVKQLLFSLEQAQNLEPIWDKIKTAVSELLWDEFQEAYPGPEGRPDFDQLIASGIYIPIPDLTAIGQQLRQSLGYRHYVEAQKLELTTHCFGLFAETGRREESARKRPRTGKFDI